MTMTEMLDYWLTLSTPPPGSRCHWCGLETHQTVLVNTGTAVSRICTHCYPRVRTGHGQPWALGDDGAVYRKEFGKWVRERPPPGPT